MRRTLVQRVEHGRNLRGKPDEFDLVIGSANVEHEPEPAEKARPLAPMSPVPLLNPNRLAFPCRSERSARETQRANQESVRDQSPRVTEHMATWFRCANPQVDGTPPPFDLDAEAAVLSAVMLDPLSMPKISDFLRAEHFYADAHRRIFDAAFELASIGKPHDVVAIAAAR